MALETLTDAFQFADVKVAVVAGAAALMGLFVALRGARALLGLARGEAGASRSNDGWGAWFDNEDGGETRVRRSVGPHGPHIELQHRGGGPREPLHERDLR